MHISCLKSLKSDHTSFSIGASIDGWQLLSFFATIFVINVFLSTMHRWLDDTWHFILLQLLIKMYIHLLISACRLKHAIIT